MIRVMIVDDMPDVSEYYKNIIDRERDMEVCAIESSAHGAIETAGQMKPDVILMDIQMDSPEAGITATREIKTILPQTQIIMLTAHNDSDSIVKAFVAGASDYLTTGSSIVEIVNAVRETVDVKNGKTHVNKIIADELMQMTKERESLMFMLNLISRLSKGEIDMLWQACQGRTYRQIAAERGVEEVTIRTTANKIKTKLGFDSMKDVVENLKKLGVVQLLDNFIND